MALKGFSIYVLARERYFGASRGDERRRYVGNAKLIG
jgi:hypothetical protein